MNSSQAKLITDFLWCIANMAGDNKEARNMLANENFASNIGVLIKEYALILTPQHWELIVWILRCLAMSFKELPLQSTDPYIAFFVLYF